MFSVPSQQPSFLAKAAAQRKKILPILQAKKKGLFCSGLAQAFRQALGACFFI